MQCGLELSLAAVTGLRTAQHTEALFHGLLLGLAKGLVAVSCSGLVKVSVSGMGLFCIGVQLTTTAMSGL